MGDDLFVQIEYLNLGNFPEFKFLNKGEISMITHIRIGWFDDLDIVNFSTGDVEKGEGFTTDKNLIYFNFQK